MGVGEGPGGGGGGRRWVGRLVPWIPRPKLIPERDGMYGASGDTHLRMEVPGACRGPSFVLEAFCGVMAASTFIVTCDESIHEF